METVTVEQSSTFGTSPARTQSTLAVGRKSRQAGTVRAALISSIFAAAASLGVQAAPVSFQFTSEIDFVEPFSAQPDFSELFTEGDTLSGVLTYEADTPGVSADPSFAFFDLFDAPEMVNSLSINEFSHVFQLNEALQGTGEGDFFELYTAPEQVDLFGEDSINIALFIESGPGQLITDVSVLPQDIDFDAFDFAVLEVYADGESFVASAEITSFFMDLGNDQGPVVGPDGNLVVGAAQPEFFTLENGEMLLTNRTIVGRGANGTFTHEGGTYTTGQLDIGGDLDDFNNNAPGEGSYTLEGGTLDSSFTNVGARTVGTFLQSGGLHEVDLLILGNSGFESDFSGPTAGGVGTYDLFAGTLEAGLSGMIVGASGQGTFNQIGGSVIVGDAIVNSGNLGQLQLGTGTSRLDPDAFEPAPAQQRGGTYNLSGGDLTVFGSAILGGASDNESQNFGGRGTFAQTGGSAFVRDNLVIGEVGATASGDGMVTIGFGSLDVGGDIRIADNSLGGRAAQGSLLQTGGTVTVGGDIIIGESDEIVANSYRIHSGGTSASSVQVGLGGDASGTALLEVSSGGLLDGDVVINGNGVVTGHGGTFTGDITLNGGLLAPGLSPGTLNVLGDLLLEEGQLELEVGPVLMDQLIIGGDLLLGNDLLIDLIFDPAPSEDAFDLGSLFDVAGSVLFGDQFSLAENLSITGLGATDTLEVTLFGQQFTFGATNVPAPAAAWLFMLLAMGLLRKRGER